MFSFKKSLDIPSKADALPGRAQSDPHRHVSISSTATR